MKSNRSLIGVIAFALALCWAGILTAGSSPNQIANSKDLSLNSVSVEKFDVNVKTLTEVTERHDMTADKNNSGSMAQSPTQGGEDISSATVIPSMPYLDSGTTAGYADDYQEVCDNEGLLNLPDVVYSYTPLRNEVVNIVTCESSYFTRIFVYQGDADTLVGCNRFAIQCGQPPRAGIYELPMDSGKTYYIVVDGDDLGGAEPPGYGEYVLDCTREAIVDDSAQVHPGYADDGGGNVVLTYEDIIVFDDASADTMVMWMGSNDDAASFATVGGWSISGGYPSVRAFGGNGQFYGTLVPGAGEFDGGHTYLIDIDNVAAMDNWGLFHWDWTQHGWHDMQMSAIATDNQQAAWQWGMLSFISSTTYGEGLTNAPHISYPISDGSATISWLINVDGCATTAIDIDPITRRSYAVYDWLNPATSTWELLIRQDFVDSLLEDPGPGVNAWSFTVGGALEHAQYPSVAVDNSNLVIVTEYWDENSGDDRDIVCWSTSDSDIVSINLSVIAGTIDNERFPKVAHVTGNIFLCTFVRGDTLFQSLSYDAGVNWSTPEEASDPSIETLVSEYRTSDLTEAASKMVWEWRIKDDLDSAIFIRIGNSSFVLDSDGDGVNDDLDVCPGFDDNLDDDGDGVPDGCDICPGYDDTIDTDTDGIPDGCDWKCGDANGDESINVGDAVYMINFVFKSGAMPDPPGRGDANGDCSLNVGDAVYLINFVFKSGPDPICNPACVW
ncbi:MAG: hypothetical protein GY841_00830 [FCB group bacterium]|nr:hypothetical protein [FCB group bacterium]